MVQLFLEADDTATGPSKSYQVQKTGTMQAASKVQAQRKKTVGSQVSSEEGERMICMKFP